MTTVKRKAVALLLILLSLSVLLATGCGRDEAQSEGCPSGSYVANSTDTITGPADGEIELISSFGSPYPGGIVYFAPLTYYVKDISGTPRNNVCVTFYTTGFWYSDNSYSSVVIGEGSLNKVLGVTDDSGRIMLFWSTGFVPAANPVVIDATSTPPTYTAGSDISGGSWVEAYSGILTSVFTESWTVKGEPGP